MATVAMPPAKPNIIQEFLRITIPLLILGAGIGFFWISGSLKKTAKTPPPDTRAPRVVTAEVTGYQGDLQIDVDGTVVPFREMTLTSEVAGRIKSRSPLCEVRTICSAGHSLARSRSPRTTSWRSSDCNMNCGNRRLRFKRWTFRWKTCGHWRSWRRRIKGFSRGKSNA